MKRRLAPMWVMAMLVSTLACVSDSTVENAGFLCRWAYCLGLKRLENKPVLISGLTHTGCVQLYRDEPVYIWNPLGHLQALSLVLVLGMPLALLPSPAPRSHRGANLPGPDKS